jgi:hypothetical protein
MSDQNPQRARDTTRLNDAVRMVDDPVIEAAEPCRHIMALHVDQLADPTCGVIRCIVHREGDVHAPGFVDFSQLHELGLSSLYEATMGPELDIEGTEGVVSSLPDAGSRLFLGLEDPIIWCDMDAERTHLYCTIPFHDRETGATVMYLGHAAGPDVHSLSMTEPVLTPQPDHGGAKEVAVPPPAASGDRHVLVESNDTLDGTTYSVIRTATAPAMDEPWSYDDLALHPARDGAPWCSGHVSPGPILPRSFLDVGEGRCVGLLNGREANKRRDGHVTFGTFTVGLLVYDYERGDIEWFSDEPFLADPDAESITFASAFRQTGEERGLLYAHVDDSYVRAYEVNAAGLRSYLP